MILIRDTIGGYFGGYVALWRSHSVRNALMSAPCLRLTAQRIRKPR